MEILARKKVSQRSTTATNVLDGSLETIMARRVKFWQNMTTAKS